MNHSIMRKAFCFILAIVMLLTVTVSCTTSSDPDTSDTDSLSHTSGVESDDTNGGAEPDQENNSHNGGEAKPNQGNSSDHNEETKPDQENNSNNNDEVNPGQDNDAENEVELPEVYREYPILQYIGSFNQGLAPFVIKNLDGLEFSETSQQFKYGYIDIKGNVVINPIYPTKSNLSQIETFEKSNYITVSEDIYTENTANNSRKVYDRSGNIVFACGTNGVTAISSISNGYLAVETCVEEFTGYVYTITYYSVDDLREIYSIENDQLYRWTLPDETGIITDWRTEINLFEHDPFFTPIENVWSVDIESIESFQGVNCYYSISNNNNDMGQIATVTLVNRDNIYYYATVDSNGNVLMAPQKNIAFRIDSTYQPTPTYVFNHNLCPAMDTVSGLWGYIDCYGNWEIEPQYSSASEFSPDGYATVDNTVIININGTIVLSPQPLAEDDLYGTYTRESANGTYTYTLTIGTNGDLTIHISEPYNNSTAEGYYVFQGRQLVVTGIGWEMSRPLDSMNLEQDGTYTVEKTDTGLIINGLTWTKVTED